MQGESTRLIIAISKGSANVIYEYWDTTRLDRQIGIDNIHEFIVNNQMSNMDPTKSVVEGVIYAVTKSLYCFVNSFHKLKTPDLNDSSVTVMLIGIFAMISVLFDDPKDVVIVINSQHDVGSDMKYGIEHMWVETKRE